MEKSGFKRHGWMAFVIIGFAGVIFSRESSAVPRGFEELCMGPKELREKGMAPVEISAVTPTLGGVLGGTTIKITGSGFESGAAVYLGKSYCNHLAVLNDKEIQCRSKPHQSGDVDVTVVNPNRRCGYLSKAFYFVPEVVMEPKTSEILAGGTVNFHASSGKSPYTFSLVEGPGSIDSQSGVYKAPSEPDSEGVAIVRVTDSRSNVSEAVVRISRLFSMKSDGELSYVLEWGKPPYTLKFVESEGSTKSGSTESGSTENDKSAEEEVDADTDEEDGDGAESGADAGADEEDGDSAESGVDTGTDVGAEPGVEPSVEPGAGAGGGSVSITDKPVKLLIQDSTGRKSEIAFKTVVHTLALLIHPTSKEIKAGEKAEFIVSGGAPPYTFSIQEGGVGTIEADGIYRAGKTAGDAVIHVKDSKQAMVEARVTVLPEPEKKFGSVLALGGAHTCAGINGQLWCWGDDRQGQLGDYSVVSSSKPIQAMGVKEGVIAAAAGLEHTCAILDGGSVKCWGSNRHGQLGDGTTVNALVPQTVLGLGANVDAIAAGSYHTCAIVQGAVRCWGSNSRGQLGIGNNVASTKPILIPNLRGVKAIGAGSAHTCALAEDGVYCWGYNDSGQLGDGTLTERWSPVKVKNVEPGATALVVGGFHSCVLTGNAVKCWGGNGLGQLGNGTKKNSKIPVETVEITGTIKAISAGYYHTCVLTDGAAPVQCWGYNRYGQVGSKGKQPAQPTPVPVEGLNGEIKAIGTGDNHTCAILADGMRCWGDNEHGQLGDRTTLKRTAPVMVNVE